MTIPWMMNCSHSDEGWCLDCVVKMGNTLDEARGALHRLAERFAEVVSDTVDEPDYQRALAALREVE